MNDSILDSTTIHLYIKLFIKNFSYPLNPIQHPLKWWDLFKTKIKYKLIFYSETQQNNISKIHNTRFAESEDYDPTPTPRISKLPTPTPTPDFNFDYDSDSAPTPYYGKNIFLKLDLTKQKSSFRVVSRTK